MRSVLYLDVHYITPGSTSVVAVLRWHSDFIFSGINI